MATPVDPAEVIAATYDSYMLRDRQYPGSLPEDLAPWHLYIIDGGHSALVTLSATGEDGHEVAAPVKTVLRHGWTVLADGRIHADLPYDPQLGLITEPGDDEH
ncbi:hypothetical protein [Nocardia carnea]|uniref:hypothetical protein n=1 Tax=Nocardia carnea TaxID=37328 RepID=UPI0024560384|nr:hypothetical protein [Nocardia carnea]